jgi:hypothetical protein
VIHAPIGVVQPRGMFRKKSRRAAPLPNDPEKSYIERYRGTEWDTGFGLLKSDPERVTVNAFTGFLAVALVFVILAVAWLLLTGSLA